MKVKTITRLDREIENAKNRLADCGPMRPGSLTRQTRRNRNRQSYGSYWHLTFAFQGKIHTQYVAATYVKQIKEEIQNFKRFRKIIDQLIDLSLQRSRANMEKEAQVRKNAEQD
jgi:hypothetical protein